MIQQANEEKLGWSCPVCGTFYFCIGAMKFCPACNAQKMEKEREYWANRRAGMRSITDEIVARALGK